jgi:hypothetical protein
MTSQVERFGVVEIGRRRRWSDDEKLRRVAGASFKRVYDRPSLSEAVL